MAKKEAVPTATRQVGSKSPDKLPDKFDTNNKYIRNMVKFVDGEGTNAISKTERAEGGGLRSEG